MTFGPIPEEASFLEPLGNNSDNYFKKIFPTAMALCSCKWFEFESGYNTYFLIRYYCSI